MNIIQPTITIPILTVIILIFGYTGVPLWLWTLLVTAALWGFNAPIWLWVIFCILALVFNIQPLRRLLVTSVIMKVLTVLNILPKISETERVAIEAGTVWIEDEFFSGKPNFKRISSELYPQSNPEEQTFLDGPVEALCRLVDDWEVQCRKDLPPEVWNCLKENFFGMMIPKEYGGLALSNLVFSRVMAKLASRSSTLAATVGVPNSLGPAKLLIHYGTPAQKDYYLPRLACGEEIPCFAMTEPGAGSDATSMTSHGIVFKGEDDCLYLRLNWKKRYISLGAISTLLGLAFKLRDPENLLGKGENIGITCALIPTNTPGVVFGQRHDPMGVPFYNSPTEGHDVIISIDQIIGGIEGAGRGWIMLMESISGSRAIAFPATTTGIAKLVNRVVGAYTTVRKQFGLSIGRFEGVEEPLARIGGLTYLMDAARIYTCGAIERGIEPSVISAIVKYHFTEFSRKIVNDGMDVMGGAAICRGPRNLLANLYMAIPIPITVEGANILTRTLIIFGQGIIRCHPYIQKEIEALNQSDLTTFDKIFWSHIGWVIRNFFRAGLLSVSRGYLARSPVSGSTAKYYRKLAWASASFALFTDLAMASFGGTLKRREKLTGRFADILSWMYLGVATLRRFEAEGRRQEDLPFVHWAMQYALAQIQCAFDGILTNMPVPVLGTLLRGPVAFWLRLNPIGTPPSDQLGSQIARRIQKPGTQRDALTEGIYIPSSPSEALGRLERAFLLSCQAEPVLKKIKEASRVGQLPKDRSERLVKKALEAGMISREEAEWVYEAEEARLDAIQVDAFDQDEYFGQIRN